jgi:hypothetical protein
MSEYNTVMPHEVIYFRKCKNNDYMHRAELLIHDALDDFRENPNHEWFILPKNKTIEYFKEILDRFIV